jgi:hypothetical protein
MANSRVKLVVILLAAGVAVVLVVDALVTAQRGDPVDWRTACAAGPASAALNDVHMHVPLDADTAIFATALLRDMNEAGIGRAVVQPDHTKDKRRSVGALQKMDEQWGAIAAECGRIVPLLYGFDPDDPDAWPYVERQLLTGRFGGVGEIELLHSKMQIRHRLDSPTMQKTLALLDARRLAMHFQSSHEDDPQLSDEIVATARAFPNARFVWFGSRPPIGPALELTNLWFTTFVHADVYRPDAQTDPRQLLWGSDTTPAGIASPSAGALPYDTLLTGAQAAKEVLDPLPASVSGPIARGNFEAIWPTRADRTP